MPTWRSTPGEQQDIAADNPDRVGEMLAGWRQYAQQNNIVLNDDLTPADPIVERPVPAQGGR